MTCIVLHRQSDKTEDAEPKGGTTSDAAELSYAIGVSIGENLKKQGLNNIGLILLQIISAKFL